MEEVDARVQDLPRRRMDSVAGRRWRRIRTRRRSLEVDGTPDRRTWTLSVEAVPARTGLGELTLMDPKGVILLLPCL